MQMTVSEEIILPTVSLESNGVGVWHSEKGCYSMLTLMALFNDAEQSQ